MEENDEIKLEHDNDEELLKETFSFGKRKDFTPKKNESVGGSRKPAVAKVDTRRRILRSLILHVTSGFINWIHTSFSISFCPGPWIRSDQFFQKLTEIYCAFCKCLKCLFRFKMSPNFCVIRTVSAKAFVLVLPGVGL